MKVLKVHLRKSLDANGHKGVTECGEPFHHHPQDIGTGRIIEGEYESSRRIGGLRAYDEFRFGQAASQRHGHACAKCRKVWMADDVALVPLP